jgi:hypothetical protein
MTSTAPQPVFNFTGSGNNVQIGNDNTQNVTQNFGNTLTPDVVIDKLTESLPPEDKEQVIKEVFGPLRHEFNALAAMPIADVEAQKPTIMGRIQGFVSNLSKYQTSLPTIQKMCLGFTEAALNTIAPPVGALVAGTLGLIRAIKPSSTPAFPPKREPPSSGFGEGGFSSKPPSGSGSGFGSGFNSGMQ